MYIYNIFDKNIILKKFLNFKFEIFDYFSGKLYEEEFKILRLNSGLYRQKYAYMYRIALPYGIINIFQINLLSYIIKRYDKNYLHFTTRTNIQLNWIKIIEIFEIFNKLKFVDMHSIQTSGNCVRNITVNQQFKSEKFNFINPKPWAELLRQWFTINSEFLFLPRKFKIVVVNYIENISALKIHDMGIYIKKNKFDKIIFNILIGGGLGRTPIIGFFIFKNLHWKNIINYCNKIIFLYNIYGFRYNIYKSRIKILLKSIIKDKFRKFILKDLIYNINYFYIINEKELNKFLFYFLFFLKKSIFLKKINFNLFFLNWLKFNIINKNYFFIVIILKIFNVPSGDINIFQLKILLYFSNIFGYRNIYINNKQNIILNEIKNFDLYFFYKKFKKYFYIIYGNNLLNDIVCCPGLDYCSLANTSSISTLYDLQKIFTDYNSIVELDIFTINVSGCVNSCSHHNISNIGILGIQKNNFDYYQIYLAGNNNYYCYNNLKLSKILGASFLKINFFIILNKIIKFYIYLKKTNELFVDFCNRFDYYYFKNLIFNKTN